MKFRLRYNTDNRLNSFSRKRIWQLLKDLKVRDLRKVDFSGYKQRRRSDVLWTGELPEIDVGVLAYILGEKFQPGIVFVESLEPRSFEDRLRWSSSQRSRLLGGVYSEAPAAFRLVYNILRDDFQADNRNVQIDGEALGAFNEAFEQCFPEVSAHRLDVRVNLGLLFGSSFLRGVMRDE